MKCCSWRTTASCVVRCASYRNWNFDVAEVGSGEEALSRVSETPPDLVVLDLTLPGIDGLETLRHLRTFSDVPIVVLTVRDALRDKVAAVESGADDYVLKPFDPDELLARSRAPATSASRGPTHDGRGRGRSRDRPVAPAGHVAGRSGAAHADRAALARGAPRPPGQAGHARAAPRGGLGIARARAIAAGCACSWCTCAASCTTTRRAPLDPHRTGDRLPLDRRR